jgi:prophage regulatory protein
MKILRLKEVTNLTGLSRSTLYDRITQGAFPANISLGGNTVGWVEHEVTDWIQERINERNNKH